MKIFTEVQLSKNLKDILSNHKHCYWCIALKRNKHTNHTYHISHSHPFLLIPRPHIQGALISVITVHCENSCEKLISMYLTAIINKILVMKKCGLQIRVGYQRLLFSFISTETYLVGTQKNSLTERVLSSTQNMILLRDKKITSFINAPF